MGVGREELIERHAKLVEAERAVWANLNTTIGARLECEFWLDFLDKREAEPKAQE